MIRKIINVPIYNQIVEIIKAKSILDIDDYVQNKYPEEQFPCADGNQDGRTWTTSQGYIIIGIEESSTDVLIHELGHATWSILNRAGVSDEEAFCYLLSFLYKESKFND